MDYPGWELERQRAALTALLLGGGAAEGERAPRQRERRNPAEVSGAAGAARRDEKRSPGDGAAGAGRKLPGGRTAVQEASRDRWKGTGGEGSPESAWEETPGAETAAELPEQTRRGRRTLGPEDTAAPDRKANRELSGNGAGVREGSGGPSAMPERRGTEKETPALRSLERFSESPPGRMVSMEADDGYPLPPSDTGSGLSAGKYAAGRLERGLRLRRSGGGMDGALGQDGLPVFYKVEQTGGTDLRRGGLGGGDARAEDGAKALSRAVQRDARRYDGGFTIY